jgi:hypothetical protein
MLPERPAKQVHDDAALDTDRVQASVMPSPKGSTMPLVTNIWDKVSAKAEARVHVDHEAKADGPPIDIAKIERLDSP